MTNIYDKKVVVPGGVVFPRSGIAFDLVSQRYNVTGLDNITTKIQENAKESFLNNKIMPKVIYSLKTRSI